MTGWHKKKIDKWQCNKKAIGERCAAACLNFVHMFVLIAIFEKKCELRLKLRVVIFESLTQNHSCYLNHRHSYYIAEKNGCFDLVECSSTTLLCKIRNTISMKIDQCWWCMWCDYSRRSTKRMKAATLSFVFDSFLYCHIWIYTWVLHK